MQETPGFRGCNCCNCCNCCFGVRTGEDGRGDGVKPQYLALDAVRLLVLAFVAQQHSAIGENLATSVGSSPAQTSVLKTSGKINHSSSSPPPLRQPARLGILPSGDFGVLEPAGTIVFDEQPHRPNGLDGFSGFAVHPVW
jgi:hypothetical protein